MSQADDFGTVQLDQAPKTRYSINAPRNQPDVTGHADCSGYQTWAMHKLGLWTPQPEMSSFTISQWCHQSGTGMMIDPTKRGWVFEGINEGQGPTQFADGHDGHIAWNLANGFVIAARSAHLVPNVGLALFGSHVWSYQAWPPGLARDDAPHPSTGDLVLDATTQEQIKLLFDAALADMVNGAGPTQQGFRDGLRRIVDNSLTETFGAAFIDKARQTP